jgi:hypothetical protein
MLVMENTDATFRLLITGLSSDEPTLIRLEPIAFAFIDELSKDI